MLFLGTIPMTLEDVMAKLEAIERKIALPVQQKTYYTIAEAAALLHKTEYTVREYCRLGAMLATKTNLGCGQHRQWRIAATELERFQQAGKRRA
jgi:hypothetical protein